MKFESINVTVCKMRPYQLYVDKDLPDGSNSLHKRYKVVVISSVKKMHLKQLILEARSNIVLNTYPISSTTRRMTWSETQISEKEMKHNFCH